MIICRSTKEISRIRQAGRIVAGALELAERIIEPGLATKDLNGQIEKYITAKGAIPAFKGYRGYPAATCVSVNNVVVHGIPSDQVVKRGDIVGVDVGVKLDGYFGDAAATFTLGPISAQAKRLIATTKEALEAGIAAAVPGANLYDVSGAIQEVAEAGGYSVVRQFVGHGIGRQMHEEPQIPNYRPGGRGPQLAAGMVLALEPMVNIGGSDVLVLEDGWTVVTADNSLSAHFEHTIAITEQGSVILTVL